MIWTRKPQEFGGTTSRCTATRPTVALRSISALAVFVAMALSAAAEEPAPAQESSPSTPRPRWTTSRVRGTPEPPLAYTVEKTFQRVAWKAPIYIIAEPGTQDLLVVQQGGERDRPSRILRVRDTGEADRAELFLEVPGRLVYSVTFDPRYRENGVVYVFSNGPTGAGERFNRISRYLVRGDEERACDSDSERSIIEWPSAGHDGGDMVFGHDGMLYISSGDGTGDSDSDVTGQDLSNLLAAVLRIDVRSAAEEGDESNAPAYTIPSDNPFVEHPGARGEIWAYGLRNPWRMSIDRKTGRIWVGTNGQDLWETAHLLGRGENYGWSVYEGNHPFYLHRELGPTPFVPPTLEHHHHEARSLTGGVVYYGAKIPDLEGVYVYGDYATGKIWGARHDGARVTWKAELADTSLQIAGFGLGHSGDLYVVDHGGGIYKLVPRPPQGEDRSPFPRRLSETGIYESVAEHRVAPGIIRYSVNAPGWNDGADVDRFVALPGDARASFAGSRGWNFPNGAVLVQTLSLAGRRVETRLLHRERNEWRGYSFRWLNDGSDAELVPKNGLTTELAHTAGASDESSPGGRTWRFPSRTECLSCHSRAANFVLGLRTAQVNRSQDFGHGPENQLRAFVRLEALAGAPASAPDGLSQLVDPYDETAGLELRVRSYLDANCAGCHVEAGGGNAKLSLAHSTALAGTNLISHRPQHHAFEIANAMIVAPGNPERSVLLQRLSRRGSGQMPPLASLRVDERAVTLVRAWIESLPVPERRIVRDWTLKDFSGRVGEVTANRSFAAGQAAFESTGCTQCHRFRRKGGGVGPDLTNLGSRMTPEKLLEALIEPSKTIAPGYATTIVQTSDGEVYTGRIDSEDEDGIVLRTVASFAEPTRIEKSEIVDRSASTESIMPAGALDTLEAHEVLDLLAFLLAGGSREHPAFE